MMPSAPEFFISTTCSAASKLVDAIIVNKPAATML
jgi:hypothetical protein